jgi:hypothetical protein
MQTFTFYADPGHGWLAVPRALLHELGIADDITPYSYQRLDHVYLEEDCDFSTFVRAMRAAGREFKTLETHSNGDSFVRALSPYQVEN